MPADLIEDVNAGARMARTALVRTVRKNDRRAKGLLKRALRSAREASAAAAVHVRRTSASAADHAEHRYFDFKSGLRQRPFAALAVGAGFALGLGLLLWTGYRMERETSAT